MSVILLNNKLKGVLALILCFVAFFTNAQTPAPPQSKSILLLNATAHLGNGEVIPRAAIGIKEGKINMVLAAFDIRMDSTKYDTIIHLDDKHIYPGFIAPNSRLGLIEINAVRASRDQEDVGEFRPHVRSLVAYNTESRITPTVRTNGVLIAEVAPVGGILSGTSSIFELDGWNWEDAVLKEDNGIHLNWPEKAHELEEKKEELKKKAKHYQKQVSKIDRFFKEAKAYHNASFHLEKNLRFEAMNGLFNGSKKLFIHANEVQEITDAIYFFDQYDIKIVLVGAYDAGLVSDLLKDREIPVLLRRVHSLPMSEDDAIDTPYRLPKLLSDKGLLIGLENSGDMEAMGTRNLAFYAGTAVAYGVEKEKALSMISLNTAKILGIDKRVGSIEIGKDATLFVSEGDALDMRSNQLVLAYIQGRKIDLNNPQLQLYRKYSKRYKH